MSIKDLSLVEKSVENVDIVVYFTLYTLSYVIFLTKNDKTFTKNRRKKYDFFRRFFLSLFAVKQFPKSLGSILGILPILIAVAIVKLFAKPIDIFHNRLVILGINIGY